MTQFSVTVGNIGSVYEGNDEAAATQEFKYWVSQSEESKGRAAGESVTLWEDGEPVKEHEGKQAE